MRYWHSHLTQREATHTSAHRSSTGCSLRAALFHAILISSADAVDGVRPALHSDTLKAASESGRTIAQQPRHYIMRQPANLCMALGMLIALLFAARLTMPLADACVFQEIHVLAWQ